MASIFQDLTKPSAADRTPRLQLSAAASTDLTKDERRLLTAIAAAQAEDADLVDNFLYKLCLDRALRSRLADAVTSLAAYLALQGHWLPRPGTRISFRQELCRSSESSFETVVYSALGLE